MPSVDYSYQLSTTCASGVNIDALSYEIRASEITKNLHYVFVDNDSDNVIVWFRETLTPSDEDRLIYLLQNHKGLPVGMTTTSGVYPDYSKSLIINEEGEGIGVSSVMPFHVTTVTTAAPHALDSESHTGQLVDSQIPSSIARYDTLASGYLNDLYYTEDELDDMFSHLSAGTITANFTYNGAGSITVSGCEVSFFTKASMDSPIVTLNVAGNTFNLTLNVVNYIVARYNNGSPVMENILNVDLIDEALVIPLLTITTNNNEIHVLNWRDLNAGLSNRLHARFVRTDRFKRENGFTMYVDNKHLVCSAGVAWYGAMRNIIPAFDSHTELMDMFYTVSGTWITQPTNLLENNYYGATDGLVEAGDGSYVNCWIYRYISNVTSTKAAFILGTDDFYSLRRAETEFLPSVPPFLTRHAILLGRITFVKGASSSTTMCDVLATRIPGNASDTHNALDELQPVGAGEYYHLDTFDFLNLTGGHPVFSSISGTFYGSGASLSGIDHGNLVGLSDDDHTQYFNVARGDARYYTETEVNTISGILNSKIITDHGSLGGLYDDDHTQYHTDARGDLRYSQLGHLHDDRYYTETELNNGQLDSRYYTESEVNTISGNINTTISSNYSTLNNKINTASGTLQSQINNLDSTYATDAQVNTISGAIVSQIITDHGALSGRADDDHTQYLLTNGTRQLSDDWNYGSSSISGTGGILASMFTGGYIDLNNLVNPPHKEGRLFWDNANHALAVYNEVNGITQQVGQESYVRVYNSKGYTIPNGSIVTVDGSFNENPTVQLSIASSVNHVEHQDLGMCTNAILPGEIGYITTFGMVHDLNTSSFQSGDLVYTSATVSGGLTNVPPASPNKVTEIGWVITAHATDGIVLVNVKKNASLKNLSDVDADNLVDGDIISYNDLTKTWKAVARNSHAHTAEQISFAVDDFYSSTEGIQNNVDYALKEHFENIYMVGGTGRNTPDVVAVATGTFELTVYSGSGYIFKEDKIWEVTWSGTTINTFGYAEDYYWVYVDIDNQVHVTNVETNPLTVIRIASFYTVGPGVISVLSESGFWFDNALGRLAVYMRHMGAFIYDDGGTVLPRTEDVLTIRSTACKVQNLFRELQLTEVSSLDIPNRFNTWFKTVDGWVTDDYMRYSDGGRIPVDRYNNVTGSGVGVLPYNCTTTSGSSTVTSSGNLTSYLSYGDLIYKTSDTIFNSALVSGVSWNGSQSTVTLVKSYIGAGGTGSTTYINALDAIPSGKWVKHLVIRTYDDKLHFVYSQCYYDSEQLALDGGYPELPDSLSQRALNMASIVVSPGTTSLVGKIHDIRPLPFYDREGGKQTGGTASTHGDLSGLDADDHLQYLTETRGDSRYYTKILLNAGQLDSRYYTETEINAIDTAISGALQSQINNKSALGHLHDDRYFTETELNAGQLNNLYYTETELNNGQLDSRYFTETELNAGQLNNLYYTEAEVNTISGVLNTRITSVSGSLQTSINGKSDIGHTHDDRYYTETELNNGQLDSRYYTESEVNTISGNIVSQLHPRQHGITSTSDHTATANRVFYSNNSGVITELPLGVSGTVLTSTGNSAAPVWTSNEQISTVLPICQIKRTTTLTLSAGVWTDVTFNIREIETDDSVIQYDTVNTDRITIKQSGYYIVDYDANIYYEGTSRVRVNDTTVIDGSYIPKDGDQYCTVVSHSFSRSAYVYLNANDFITLQLMSNYGLAVSTNASLSIAAVKGIKGDTGAAGAAGIGSTIAVQNNGSLLPNSPFNTFNFKNATVSGSTTSGVVDITVTAASTSPGSPTSSVQFNNAGSFGGDAGFIYSSASDKVTISGAGQTTRLVLGGENDNNNAALYIQVDGDATSEGMRCYFKRSEPGISGWIIYHYDQATPNIRLIDEDDDPPYIAFQTINAGTYNSPQFDNRFGTRGPTAGATTGFQWIVNGTSISEMDSQFFTPPKGTTAQRPGTPVAGMTRFNTTISGLENYDGRSWQPQVFGTYFNEASDETDSSTTSTSWSQKVRLTTASLPAGKYRIGWSYNVRGASTSVSPRTQVQINDTDTVHTYLFEPKDASSNEEDSVGGFYYYTVSTGGTTLDIDLDYSSETNGSSMTIRRARLEFWRVS